MICTRVLRLCALAAAALAAGCGGGSGDGSSGAPDGVGASKIFVADAGHSGIATSPTSNPPAGTLLVDRLITGPNTQLDTNIFDMALDVANDRLYVADLRSVVVFNGASTANGNAFPARVVATLPGTLGGFNGGLYLDTANNRLYVATTFAGTTQTIDVFDNAGTASAATPTRTITFTTNAILDIAVDTTRDILYAYNVDAGGFNQLSVFDHASTLNGSVTPSRTVSFNDSGGSGPVGIFIDAADDRLYVPRNGGTIAVFDTASQANGSVATTAVPSRTINLPVPTYSVVFVDLSSNRLYALDANGIDIIASASTVNGTPPTTTRVIAPTGSNLQAIAVAP